MAYISGSGCLIARCTSTDNDLSYRYKAADGDGDPVAEESILSGLGLDYVDGERMSYVANLRQEDISCIGSASVDNMYFLPKIPLTATFKIQPINLIAEFQIGRGN